MKRAVFIFLLAFFALSFCSADIVDTYVLNMPNKQVLYQHHKGWYPIPRDIAKDERLTVMFYRGFYRHFILTLDTKLHLKACLTLSEDAGLLHIKRIRVTSKSGFVYYDVKPKQSYFSPYFSEENLLYNEDGTVFETEDKKNLYFNLFDLDTDVRGRKALGWSKKAMKVTIEYTLGHEEYKASLDYLCYPHHMTLIDFIALFALP